MASNTHNRRRDLQSLAADLKWSAVELIRIAERLSQAGNEPDAQALHRMIAVFQREEGRLGIIVNEIPLGESFNWPRHPHKEGDFLCGDRQ